MKNYTDEDYDRTFTAMSDVVEGEPVMLVLSAALSLIGVMFTHARDEDAVRFLAFDCYTAITKMAEDVINELESEDQTRH